MVFLRPIRSIIHSVTNTPVEGDKLTVGNRAQVEVAPKDGKNLVFSSH